MIHIMLEQIDVRYDSMPIFGAQHVGPIAHVATGMEMVAKVNICLSQEDLPHADVARFLLDKLQTAFGIRPTVSPQAAEATRRIKA